MMRQAECGRGRMMSIPETEEACLYDADLFTVVWRPAVAAASVVFDHAVDESVLREALDGFLGVARVAGHHRLTEVMDHLVATLCKFAAPAHVVNAAAAAAASGRIGEIVSIATVCEGDSLWPRACVHRRQPIRRRAPRGMGRHRGPDPSPSGDGRPVGEGARGALGGCARRRDDASLRRVGGVHLGKGGEATEETLGGSSLLRGFSQLLSLESDAWGGGGGEAPPTEAEKEAEARATRCVEACRVDEIFDPTRSFSRRSPWPPWPPRSLRPLRTRGAVDRAETDGDGRRRRRRRGCGGASSSPPTRVDDDAALFASTSCGRGAASSRDRVRVVLPHVYGVLRAVVRGAKPPVRFPSAPSSNSCASVSVC